MRFFLPLKRDIKTVPPLIALIRGLIKLGHEVHLFTYYNSPETLQGLDSPLLKVTCVSDKPYPKSPLARLWATFRAYRLLWREAGRMEGCDYLWVSSWDYVGLERIAAWPNVRAKVIYHSHEYEPERFGYCRKAALVVVPEENRGWLTYVHAGLRRRPLVLPNIPMGHPGKRLPRASDPVLDRIEAEGRKVVLYQGYVALRERCLPELIEAISLCDPRLVLCIMPASPIQPALMSKLVDSMRRFGVQDRVFFLETRVAPLHLGVIARAHIGIGLYRPTSINQVYCAPNRLYEFTGFGIPVVLPDSPGMNQVAARYPGVVTCDPEKPARIAEALRSLLDDDKHALARRSAEEFFAKEADYYSRLRDVVDQLP